MEQRFPKPRPTVVDFFCGAGGMSLGFEQAGFDIALGIDIDGHHAATHERNFPYGKSLCASIVDLDGDRVREVLGTEEIDVVVGGPPCQGFSFMGLRDLKDPRNSLIDHYLRLVCELRPKAFVMENVPGLVAGATKEILHSAIRLAEANGYRITQPVQILNAADFGVPQHRRRLFMIGVRVDIADAVPYPTGPYKGQPSRPTVAEAISDLPVVENFDYLFSGNDAPYGVKPKTAYAKAARGTVIDPSDLSRPRTWSDAICSGCLRTQHAPKSVSLYEATPQGETVPGHKLPRLDANGICPTLRAGSDSTHGSYTAPRPIHPLYPRCITSREAARLHGFPDWFAFYPLKWHAYRQIGNAVCPPVARAIGYSIRSVLGGRTTVKAPAHVAVGETFILPEDRPRSLRRIPQIKQFPPVIEYLFDQAFDKRRGRLKKPGFTFADVQEAIRVTGVNLPWVREDTFLPEIARSRRVNEMLASVVEHGYSIALSTEGPEIGRFVEIGTAGTLEEKELVQVRIDELHKANTLELRSFDLNGTGSGVVEVLSQDRVQKKLWRRSYNSVELVGSLWSDAAGTGAVYSVKLRQSKKSEPKVLPVLTCKTKALPTKSRITRIGKQHDSDNVAVLAAATSRHLIAVSFADCRTNAREVSRAAFEIEIR